MRTNKVKYLTFMFMEAVWFCSLRDADFGFDSSGCKSAHVRPTQQSDLCLLHEDSAGAFSALPFSMPELLLHPHHLSTLCLTATLAQPEKDQGMQNLKELFLLDKMSG